MGRVPGVESISSSSRFGRSRVTAEFGDGVDLDVAATDARDAVARIRNALPDEAEEPRIVKADDNADAVIRIGVTSPDRSVDELTQLVTDLVEDRLISVPGVADLQINGDRERLFRVDIDPTALASRGLTLADLRAALANAAFDAPAGELSSSRDQSISVRTTAALATPAEFEAIVAARRHPPRRRRDRDARPRSGRKRDARQRPDRDRARHRAAGAVEHARDLGGASPPRSRSSTACCPRTSASSSPPTRRPSSRARFARC